MVATIVYFGSESRLSPLDLGEETPQDIGNGQYQRLRQRSHLQGSEDCSQHRGQHASDMMLSIKQ